MTRHIVRIALIVLLAASNTAAHAADRTFRLAAEPALVKNGFLKFLLPRFSLKTGVRIVVVGKDGAEGADAVLAASPKSKGSGPDAMFVPVAGGDVFTLAIRTTPARALAERFRNWLQSKIGHRTIGTFRVDGKVVYAAVDVKDTIPVEAAPTGDAARGEKLALRRCGRCHVVNARNRFAGIGSTPSFGAIKTLPRWRQRFAAFWTLNPHPAFTQVEGVTEPFDPARPSPIAPLLLTLAEIEAINAFVYQIKPKDLGAPLQMK